MKDALDLDPEAFAVDRALRHPGRVNAVMTQRGEEGHGLPVTMRCLGIEPLTPRAPSAQRRHVGFSPGLIDKDEARRINPALILLPPHTPPGNVRPILLGGQQAFF